MYARIVDIIVFLMDRLSKGQNLAEIDMNDLKTGSFNRAEISAAYSWVLQKNQSNQKDPSSPYQKPSHRILHMAERLIIKPKAYGFLLELVNLGILTSADAEQVIEHIMLNSAERIDLPKMKELVSKQLFTVRNFSSLHNIYLKGNETIH